MKKKKKKKKMKRNNPNLDLVKIYAYTKFDQIPSIRLQDIKQKRKFENNDGPYPCCKFANIDS